MKIPTSITKAEQELMGDSLVRANHTILEQRVSNLNNRAMELTKGLARFKTRLLSDVISCRVFTTNYPLLIDHILREAKFYFHASSKISKIVKKST